MNRRVIHSLLAIGLAVSVFAGAIATGSAQEPDPEPDGPYEVYFPWVPNGAEIDDSRGFDTSGPYDGTVTIQNLEDEDIVITHETTATGDTDTDTIEAHGTHTLTTGHLFDSEDDVDGSGVLVTAVIDDESDDPARISGVQKQASPEALGEVAATDEDHETVAGYTGLAEDEVGSDVALPIAQTNTNWNTLIRVTNFDAEDASDISVTFHSADESGWTATLTESDVEAGETVTFDLLESGPPGEWVGSATIETDVNVGAVAERIKNETGMLIMNVSRIAPENGNEQYAPLVFNNYNYWNTGISIANLTDSDNEVEVTYYDLDGDPIGDPDELTLSPNGMSYVYTPAEEDGDGFVGSAIVESEGPIAGAIDEVKYFGDDLDTGHAMSYMIEPESAESGQSLVSPLIQKGAVDEMDIGHGDTSGIHLFNPSDDSVVAGITYLDQDGDIVHTDVELIDGKGGHTSYTLDLDDLPDGFQGSAIVQNVAGDGTIVGATNNVNYDVEFDGSASFNLVTAGEVGPEIPSDLIEDVTNGE